MVLAAVQDEVLNESKAKRQEFTDNSEAKEENGGKEQEVEGQWRRGGGALKFGFRAQGCG